MNKFLGWISNVFSQSAADNWIPLVMTALICLVVALCFACWEGGKRRVMADRTASRAIALKEAKENSA